MRNNKHMDEKELTVLVHNEVEWRKMLWKKVETNEDELRSIQSSLTGLKLKVSFFASLFGFMAGKIATSYFQSKGG